MRAYSDPSRENDPCSLPDVEIVYVDEADANDKDTVFWNHDDNEPGRPGWYFWYCFPGCMPDSDPHGPYPTEDEALAAAQEENE